MVLLLSVQSIDEKSHFLREQGDDSGNDEGSAAIKRLFMRILYFCLSELLIMIISKEVANEEVRKQTANGRIEH